MHTFSRRLMLLALPLLFAVAPTAPAADKAPRTVTPEHRNNQGWWANRHKQKLAEIEKRGDEINLVFIGDSITHGFENAGKDTWKKYYAPRGALNLGYSGDRTEHVLWRFENGELDGLNPKLAVIMIGTNNTGHNMDAPENIAAGIEKIVEKIRAKWTDTEILLLGIFPRGAEPDHKMRVNNRKTNELIAKLDQRDHVHYLNINDKFLTEDGTLTKQIMPDRLHPKQKGYAIWAQAIEPTIKKLMKE